MRVLLKTVNDIIKEFNGHTEIGGNISFNDETMPYIVSSMKKYFGMYAVLEDDGDEHDYILYNPGAKWYISKRWIETNSFGKDIKKMFNKLIEEL